MGGFGGSAAMGVNGRIQGGGQLEHCSLSAFWLDAMTGGGGRRSHGVVITKIVWNCCCCNQVAEHLCVVWFGRRGVVDGSALGCTCCRWDGRSTEGGLD